jgi:Domain of unknown function (DUF1707)/Cell wall-active antibiotics response 4TMS YvqF
MTDLPELRVSDDDRERAALALREHCVAGRLTLEEFSQRVEQAYAAKTSSELEQVAADLPATAGRPRRKPKRLTVVVFGDTERTGRWRLPKASVACVVFGNADIDLRAAELDGSDASLTAFVLFGNLDLYVPEGVEVDLGGFVLFGHRREWGEDVPPRAGTPLLRAKIFSLFGTADVWRVPHELAGGSFHEVIRGMRRRGRALRAG